jgi:uncharacterized membrane protein
LNPEDRSSRLDMNIVISNLLRFGVILSSAFIVVGLAIIFVKNPPAFPATVEQLTASNFGKTTLDAGVLLSGVAAANAIYVIQLGLIILLATPVVRVAASVILFAAEKDRTYVAITLIVLGILIVSIFVIGPEIAPKS